MAKMIGIRLKKAGKIYVLEDKLDKFNLNDFLVVDTQRGIELAKVVKIFFDEVREDNDFINSVIRKASDEDIEKAAENLKHKSEVLATTRKLVDKYKLNMKLVDADFTLDNSKVIISFTCEDRVDFRELVKELASILKRRIELRQIGIRDQAKSVGGFGSCGKEVCCKQYLNDFDKVSIKMAKNQNLSLNPTKISGVCGRLMCCLSYENDFYTEANKKMPKINSTVLTKDGEGQVIYNNLLKQIVTVKFANENEIEVGEYNVDDITIQEKNQGGSPKHQNVKK